MNFNGNNYNFSGPVGTGADAAGDTRLPKWLEKSLIKIVVFLAAGILGVITYAYKADNTYRDSLQKERYDGFKTIEQVKAEADAKVKAAQGEKEAALKQREKDRREHDAEIVRINAANREDKAKLVASFFVLKILVVELTEKITNLVNRPPQTTPGRTVAPGKATIVRKPDTRDALCRLILVNNCGKQVTAVVHGFKKELAAGQQLRLEQASGFFTFEVFGIQRNSLRTLSDGQLLTLEIASNGVTETYTQASTVP